MTHPFPHLGLADRAVTEIRNRLGRATAATAVPQLNIKEINLPGGGEEDEAPTRPWKLDVHAKMKNRLMVTGLGLDSEWSADLQIGGAPDRSEEQTSELQSLMRISYAVFCSKKKTPKNNNTAR